MRHLGQIGDHRLAADGLAKCQPQLGLGGLEIAAGDQLAQIDGFPLLVRQFDTDRIAPGNHGDTHGDRAHRARDVIGKPDHPGGLDPRRGFEFVQGDDRAGPDMNDLALDPEILQHALEHAGILFKRFGRQRGILGHVAGFAQKMDRRQRESLIVEHRTLRVAMQPRPRLGSLGGRSDPWRGRLANGSRLRTPVRRRIVFLVKIIGQDAFGQRLIIDIERGRVIDMLRPALGRSCEAGFNSLPGRATGPVLKHVIGRIVCPVQIERGIRHRAQSAQVCQAHHPPQPGPRGVPSMGDGTQDQRTARRFVDFVVIFDNRFVDLFGDHGTSDQAGAEDQQPAGHRRYQHPENDRHQAGGKPASEHRREL
jgi:hypothetical protein